MPSQVTVYVIGALLLALAAGSAYHFSTAAVKEKEIGSLNTQVTGLSKDKTTLEASVTTLKSSLDAKEKEMENYKELHTYADSEVAALQEKLRAYEIRIGKLKKDLEDLKAGMTEDDLRILNSTVPESIINLSNGAGSTGM